MKTYYLIRESNDGYTVSYRRICTSLEEAESHIMEYVDWYCPRGTCSIDKVDEQFNVLERRHYREGKLNEVE